MKQKLLFIDRDGTLIVEPADYQVDRVAKVELVPGVIPALLKLADFGYEFVVVSNQDGLGTKRFPQADFDAAHEHMLRIFSSQGIEFRDVLICPHLPADNCDCRKPATGLLTRLLATTDLDCTASAVVGDRDTDLELAERIGLRGFKVDATKAAAWSDLATTLCTENRTACISRVTRETQIVVAVNLDVTGSTSIATGIGFFDHMLEQIAKHAAIRIDVECNGDLDVDEHHTVEDTAICLGSAIREALGNKRGIGRYGFVLPMDESEASVSVDLSGRGVLVFDADFSRDTVGQLSTEMVAHFFQSFADALGAALHIKVTGENTHHMVEACFKAVGRAMRPALQMVDSSIPSTKGVLS